VTARKSIEKKMEKKCFPNLVPVGRSMSRGEKSVSVDTSTSDANDQA
jgi:hypothetical protein